MKESLDLKNKMKSMGMTPKGSPRLGPITEEPEKATNKTKSSVELGIRAKSRSSKQQPSQQKKKDESDKYVPPNQRIRGRT